MFHCNNLEQYLEIYNPESLEDFLRLLALLELVTKQAESLVLQTLRKRFDRMVLIITIEYVKEELQKLGASKDFQVFTLSRVLETRSNNLEHIQWQRPSRAETAEIVAHKWDKDSVIKNNLCLEDNLQDQPSTLVSLVSTKDYFAIEYAAKEHVYSYEPWLSWFFYLRTVELKKLSSWAAHKQRLVYLLEHEREQETLLFELYMQALSLIWPTEVPIPDLSGLAAAAVEA